MVRISDFIDVYKSEPQIIKAESLFFRDDEDCFETDSINDADYFVETEAICIEKDPLEELDDVSYHLLLFRFFILLILLIIFIL